MPSISRRSCKALLCTLTALGLFTVVATPAAAAGIVSQSTAQAVKADIAGALSVAVSNPPTSARNNGTQSNAAHSSQPAVTAVNGQNFAKVGALAETAEANTDGSSYACSGVVSPGGGIRIGSGGQTCKPTGSGKGGVTLDLGALPGLGGLGTVAGGDIRITLDSLLANAYLNGKGPAKLRASVANVTVRLGNGAPVKVKISGAPNQDLISVLVSALAPQLGAATGPTSNLLSGALSLITNYQPAPEPNAAGRYQVTALHVAVINGSGATADLAHVTVGPNVAVAPVDAVSFQTVPLVLGVLALLVLLAFGARSGARRVRAAI